MVAVGGTDLTTNGTGGAWQSETAWADSSGGPADDGFTIPSWQAGVANSTNQASTSVRNVPDVAAEGNTDNFLCDQGSCTGDYGGTSFAAVGRLSGAREPTIGGQRRFKPGLH